MKKKLKIALKTFIGIFIIYLTHLNIALYYSPQIIEDTNGIYNKNVHRQLRFLKQAMNNGASERMQKYYPEGFCFMQSLYGLSWSNFSGALNPKSPLFEEAMQEMDKSIEAMLSPRARIIFDSELPLRSGAFYKGWTAYLIGKKLSLQSEENYNSEQVQTFQAICQEIVDALKKAPHPYLESYQGMAWPADMTVGIAALALHDRIFPPRYSEDIKTWLDKVKNLLDPATGLIPNSVHPENGKTKEGAQGSSQSLMLIFLKEIDPDFAAGQFHLYKKYFLAYRFGLPGIREYPKGIWGGAHIDSGPVILGIGGAASLVGQQSMALYGEKNVYVGLRNSIEGFGMAYTWGKHKKYLFGQLPIADCFIAWSNSIENKTIIKSTRNWRWGFQILSVFLILPLLLIIWRY